MTYVLKEHNMASTLILSHKKIKNGIIIELVVWEAIPAIPGCEHPFNYRFFCGREKTGKCLVRYDNERGKGDHRHWRGGEAPYPFSKPEALFADFEQDVREVLG